MWTNVPISAFDETTPAALRLCQIASLASSEDIALLRTEQASCPTRSVPRGAESLRVSAVRTRLRLRGNRQLAHELSRIEVEAVGDLDDGLQPQAGWTPFDLAELRLVKAAANRCRLLTEAEGPPTIPYPFAKDTGGLVQGWLGAVVGHPRREVPRLGFETARNPGSGRSLSRRSCLTVPPDGER